MDREELALDVALEASMAYLNLLQAKTAERIQKDNLGVTRSNLELAQVRQAIGSSGPGEVYRWEAQLAADRMAVLTAQATRFQLELQLNRILDRPLEEPFGTVDTSIDDPELLVSDDRLRRHVDNPALYRVFRDFMVSEGLASAPEFRNLEAGISAQERAYRSAGAAFWAPTIALQTDLTSRLAKGGAGSELDLALPPGGPDLGAAFPRANDLNWSVGIQASFPLFEGGERIADRSQASERLEELRARYDVASQRIEQRIRNVMQRMRSSFPSMQLSADAAAAAGRNLDVVNDAYARGLASILDLLDAQNASVVAELGAASSVYAFLIDLMELQRATGGFDFFLTPEQREDFFQRMEAFFAEAGQTPAE